MFDFINKAEYFRWGESKIPLGERHGLKGCQDALILSLLSEKSGLRILEMGGGDSRILRALSKQNECWNLDGFEGRDGGPTGEVKIENVRNVIGQMGAFLPDLKNEYFDWVVSVSVMEHIPEPMLPKVFQDCRRVLRPGGFTAHGIDVYLLDQDQSDHPHQAFVRKRLRAYMQAAESAGLELVEAAAPIEDPYFRASYVSNPDALMYVWNRVAPKLRPLREVAQAVSLKAVWTRRN